MRDPAPGRPAAALLRCALERVALVVAVAAVAASLGGCSGADAGAGPSPLDPSTLALSIDPADPWPGREVRFTMRWPGQPAASCRWDFGDGNAATTAGAVTTHVYAAGGDRTVTVRCEDIGGHAGQLSRAIEVAAVELDSVAGRPCATGRQGRGWCLQLPQPAVSHLRSAAAVGSSELWVAGDSGTLLRTRDGGATWQPLFPGTGRSIHALAVPDTETAWVVGDGGLLLHTGDAGLSWEAQGGATDTLFAVAAIDARRAWAVGAGGLALRTDDGGRTWRTLATGATANLTAIAAPDPTTAWVAAADGAILATDDAGLTWRRTLAAPGVFLGSIASDGPALGYAGGLDGAMYASADRGRTWQARPLPLLADASGLCVPQAGAVVATLSNRSASSTDAGATWTLGPPAGDALFLDCTAQGTTLWAPGTLGSLHVLAWPAVDWRPVLGDHDARLLRAIAAAGSEHAWAVGDGGRILHTADGGASWSDQSAGTAARLNAVAAVDPAAAWAAGEGVLLRTEDAGARWSAVDPGAAVALHAVDVAGTAVVWVGGAGGAYASFDAGATWTHHPWQAADLVVAVDLVGPQVAWLLAESGELRVTRDGGATWTTGLLPGGGTIAYTALKALDADRAWATGATLAAGATGTLQATVDGGATWTPVPLPVGWSLRALAIEAPQTLLVVGDSGSVIVSRDGGATWQTQATPLPGSLALHGIVAPAGGAAWAVGAGGTVVKTLTGGS